MNNQQFTALVIRLALGLAKILFLARFSIAYLIGIVEQKNHSKFST